MRKITFEYKEKASTTQTISEYRIKSSKNSYNSFETKKSNKNRFAFIIIALIILLVGIFLVVFFSYKNKNKNKESSKDDAIIEGTEAQNENEKSFEDPHIETEFKFTTKIKDLKRIFVNQKYKENTLIKGVKSEIFVDRKTNYDIFIISEEDSNEDTKNFYDKMYTAAITIASECFSTKDDNCVPQRLIDLSNTDTSDLEEIEEIDDLKDLQIPLCLFNITDNDVITSITCPKALSAGKKQSMILDLYFFRPPAIKRPEKEKGNITITKEIKNDFQYIRETNGGICDVENALNSFCTTDMNTTCQASGDGGHAAAPCAHAAESH